METHLIGTSQNPGGSFESPIKNIDFHVDLFFAHFHKKSFSPRFFNKFFL